jgi:prophage regulatory protein
MLRALEASMARPEITGRKLSPASYSAKVGPGVVATPLAEKRPVSGRKLLSYKDLQARGIRLSRVHLRRLERAGLFPMHIDFGGGNFIAWFEDEIDAYLEARAAARPTPPRPTAARSKSKKRESAAADMSA